MRLSTLLPVLCSLLILTSCKQYPSIYENRSVEISDAIPNDAGIDELVEPYKDSLTKEITKVIGFLAQDLHNDIPESEIGNFMCDASLEFYNSIYGGTDAADLCIYNRGGIRINMIPKGEITVETMFELMPFENELVYMDMSGDLLNKLGAEIATRSGVPVSRNVNVLIKDGKIQDFLVNNEPVDPQKTYRVLMNDYIAKGGSDFDLLKGQPYTSTDTKVRDVLINYCEWKYDLKEPITAPITGRIIILE